MSDQEASIPMRRLTRFWLFCAVVGFLLSAAVAIGLAVATDQLMVAL
ncbi:MAG: hypothetical protein ACHP84_08430 [Caulobacterales bacterium]